MIKPSIIAFEQRENHNRRYCSDEEANTQTACFSNNSGLSDAAGIIRLEGLRGPLVYGIPVPPYESECIPAPSDQPPLEAQ